MFLFYIWIVFVIGISMGVLIFTTIGHFITAYDFAHLFKEGAWIGFRYGGVWCGGVAIVLSIMWAKKTRKNEK